MSFLDLNEWMIQQYRFKAILSKVIVYSSLLQITQNRLEMGRGDKTEVPPLQFAARLTVMIRWGGPKYTVNKQWSIKPTMFCIERKIVHVGAEKIITLY